MKLLAVSCLLSVALLASIGGASAKPSAEPEAGDAQYDYLCAKVLYGVRVHPATCDKYLVCAREKAKTEDCPEGFIFVAEGIACVKGDKVTCSVEAEEPATTEESTPEPTPEEVAGEYDYLCAKKLLGTVAHPESCTKYILCTNYKAKEESCWKGYSYSSKVGLCVKQKNGACADAPPEEPSTAEPVPEEPSTAEEVTEPAPTEPPSTTTEAEQPGPYDYICANALSGKKPHPDSCKKYITCSKGKAKEGSCKKGTYFSFYLQTCIKGNKETCVDNNQDGGGSTTVEPEPTPPESGGDPLEPAVECAQGFTGFLPIANDCTSYVYCYDGEPSQRTCYEDYIYYQPFQACLPGDTVLCKLYRVGNV